MFRVAASDYLDPLFLPELVAHLRRSRRRSGSSCCAVGEFDYRRSLASGEVDLVIGNWLEPPGELHLGKLMSDAIVCLVAEAIRRRRRGSQFFAQCGCEFVPQRWRAR